MSETIVIKMQGETVKFTDVFPIIILERDEGTYRVSQELRSLLRNFIPELILSQKRHIHMGPIRSCSGVMSF